MVFRCSPPVYVPVLRNAISKLACKAGFLVFDIDTNRIDLAMRGRRMHAEAMLDDALLYIFV